MCVLRVSGCLGVSVCVCVSLSVSHCVSQCVSECLSLSLSLSVSEWCQIQACVGSWFPGVLRCERKTNDYTLILCKQNNIKEVGSLTAFPSCVRELSTESHCCGCGCGCMCLCLCVCVWVCDIGSLCGVCGFGAVG